MIPSEYEEQCTFVAWLDMQGLRFSAIPNSTYTTSWNQKRKNHYSGVRPGVPDMMVIAPKGLAFVEMKKTKGGVVSPDQKEWIADLNKLNGVEARVCKGADEAMSFIQSLL